MDGILSVEAVLDRLTATSTAAPKHGDSVMKPGQLAAKVNAAADKDEAKQLANDLQDLTLSEYWEYPLTYTNYVMVSQKNVTGLDAVPVCSGIR